MASFYQKMEKIEDDGTIYTKVVVCVGGSDEGQLRGELEKITRAGVLLPSPKKVEMTDGGFTWKEYELNLDPTCFRKLQGVVPSSSITMPSRLNSYGIITGEVIDYDTELDCFGGRRRLVGHCGQPRFGGPVGPVEGCVPPHLVPRSYLPPRTC